MPKHLTVNDSAEFVQQTEVGQPSGVAALGSDGKVPVGQLPSTSTSVGSVNGKTGAVLLTAADVNAVDTGVVGHALGVAQLDSSGKLPVGQLSSVAVQSVNGYNGPSVALVAADVGALTQTTGDGRYVRQSVPWGVDWINVKSAPYNAVGNGVADDTAAIQAAIGAVSAQGGTVYLPVGQYLLNGSSGLSVTTAGVTLAGAGAEATKILVGGSFTGSSAVGVAAYNCQVRDLSVSGASSTTTSNPVCVGVSVSGVRRPKINRCSFFNINGWAIEVAATSSSGTSNPIGTQICQVYMNACAGGIHFLGNVTQNYAMNGQISDVQSYQGGVTSGASANLDCVRIEDAWDVLVENTILWQNAGTGSSLHIKGNSAATFVTNLDALGPLTGVCVKIEDGTNGSPQNTQISGGVIQQGSIGVQISGGSKQVHLNTSRIINNQTHGVQVDGTATTVYLNELFFSASGNGATGTNYDINWSGTAVGFINGCRFASPIVSTGTAGVQQTINVAGGQNVRVLNASFQGTGASSSNWFTNLPSAAMHESSGTIEFLTNVNFAFTGAGRVALQPSAATNNVLATNVLGADVNDRFRLLGNGTMQMGVGTSARDTTWQRIGAAQIGTNDSDIIVGLAGKGIRVKEGSNAKMGTAVLVGGTVTVSNTSVTSTSRIYLTSQTDGGTPGFLRVSARTAGTGFTITSSNAADTSTVAWVMVEPA